jgi:hypothetical protein
LHSCRAVPSGRASTVYHPFLPSLWQGDISTLLKRGHFYFALTRVSVASDGSQANDWSYLPSISADGRYVAFVSDDRSLAAGASEEEKNAVYVHDRQTSQTTCVSIGYSGSDYYYYGFGRPSISANGRYVAFEWHSSSETILVHDRQSGQTTPSLGVPDEIWISPISESLDGQPYYHLKLFYPSKGILVGLLGNAGQEGQYLSLCPQDIFSRSPFAPELFLWNPKEPVRFDSNFGNRLVDDDLGIIADEYRLLQDVSSDGLTNAQFYEIYSNPDTEVCIKVSPVR